MYQDPLYEARNVTILHYRTMGAAVPLARQHLRRPFTLRVIFYFLQTLSLYIFRHGLVYLDPGLKLACTAVSGFLPYIFSRWEV